MDDERHGESAGVYANLRKGILELDRNKLGREADDRPGQVWGVMFEIGRVVGSVTVVALADNTTSMYTSEGGGIIGAGFHESVAAATRQLLDVIELHLADLSFSHDIALPADGRWVIRALTDNGPRAVDVAESDLNREHKLWPVYRAAHGVITQLRLLDEARHRQPDL